MTAADTRARFIGTVVTDQGIMNFTPRQVEVTRTENEHEKAALTVRSSTRGTDYSNLVGLRISFSYGLPGQTMVFQGYVAEVSPQQSISAYSFLVEQTVTCLGPTMVMKGNKPRFLVNSTLTDFMRRIANDNSLGFSDEFHNDSLSWRSLAQTSESDWEMLVNLSNRLGARVVAERGVIRLIDYNDVSARELPSHYFYAQQAPTLSDGSNQGAIVSFSPVNISQTDPFYRTPSMAFLQGGSTVLVAPTSTSLAAASRRFATSMPARSIDEAKVLQSGYYLPTWSQQGDITVVGDATLGPASIVAISASSGQTATVIRPDFDGMWYIQSVRHTFYANQFYSVLTVGRASERAPNWYQARPFWLGDHRGVPQLTQAGDGTWLSSWRVTT